MLADALKYRLDRLRPMKLDSALLVVELEHLEKHRNSASPP
jgi:hypothetical protein